MDKDKGKRIMLTDADLKITLTGDTTLNHDQINNPVHYNHSGIECIEAIEAMTENMSGATAPHAANVLKYLWRHEYKNGLEDIRKAKWYLDRLERRWMEMHK